MKEMLRKAFDTKQTNQTFLVNKKKKNNLTVFELEALLRGSYETGVIPLSQTAFNIKCLKWNLKDSPKVWT